MTALDRALQLFIAGHANQLTQVERAVLQTAADIVERIHRGTLFGPEPEITVELHNDPYMP